MLKLKGKTAQFAPLIPESAFLGFCQEAGHGFEPHPIQRVLDNYFVGLLSTEEHASDSGLSIGYALWDLDEAAGLSHLVAYHGFPVRESGYPIVLRRGEGIAGGMLQKMMAADGPLQPYVASDISADPVVGAKELLLQKLHYRSAIVFPVFIGVQARGALKVYSSHKLHPSVAKEHERLTTEMARISAVVALASRMSTANLRDRLSSNFRDLDLLNPEEPPELQMGRLEETVKRCLEAVRIATSARRCVLPLGHTIIESVSLESKALMDAETDHVTLQLNRGDSRLEVQSREDGLRFSLFDRHLLEHAVGLLSRYADKYYSLRALTQKWGRRGRLLDATNELSARLLKSFDVDVVIDHLLLGIQQGFGFNALSFLRLEGDRLIPQRCVPETFHERVSKRNLRIAVLPQCRFEKKVDWKVDDCLSCRDCQGFTAIAALRCQTVSVPNLPKNPLKMLQVDPGIPAAAEYVFPLVVDDKVFGVLDLYSDNAVAISEDELSDLYGLSHTASLAISNRVLYDRLMRIQMEEAKGELAREVVHTLAPTVSQLAIHAGLIRQSLESLNGPADVIRQKQVLKSGTQGIARLRGVITQQQDIVERYQVRSRVAESVEQAIELGPIINDVKEINALRAEQKGISIHVRPAEGSERPLWLSELYMFLILWNLVQNAIKFSRGGHGEQVLITRSYTDAACVIRVSDQGVGIPKQNRPKVWEPDFSTIAPGATEPTGGQGLTIVKDNIRRTELASIDFTSAVNHGTEFVITIAQGRKYVENKLKQYAAAS